MKLPPLAAFRFFDAAARSGSFVDAARELHVTHGAVSRQIRQLEEALGMPLFERRNRAVHLNQAGRTLHATTASLFDRLESTVRQLQQQAQPQTLVVSCEPTIAMRWLIPRLPQFQQHHPEINLHLVAAGGPVDFVRSGVDLALRRDDFKWPSEVRAIKICDERMGPVCRCDTPLQAGLRGQRLLHAATRPTAWQEWQQRSGVEITASDRGEYEHFYLCGQAALAGLGVAMMSFLMVQDEIASGQLTAPWGFTPDGSAYYLLAPHSPEAGGAVEKFAAWISNEISQTHKVD